VSTFRKKFTVVWNNSDPVDVVTNARDLAEAHEYADNAPMASFVMVHSALKRRGVDVPDLDLFIDQLDEVKASSNGEDSLDPTPALDSMAEPSPYPS
jgi:hypothetical protein